MKPVRLELHAEPGTRIRWSFGTQAPSSRYSQPIELPWGREVTINALVEKTLPDGTILRSAVGSRSYLVDLSASIGATHVKSLYRPPEEPDGPAGETMLAEGARRMATLGMKALKTYLFKPMGFHPFDAALWQGSYDSPLALAQEPAFVELLSHPGIDTFALTVYSTVDAHDHYFIFRSTFSDQVWAEKMAEETAQFQDLAAWLLSDSRFGGKTFILQNWEGDWALRGNYGETTRAPWTNVLAMREWLAARQAGVDAARTAHPGSGTRVYHAAEVNKVVQAMDYGNQSPADPATDPTIDQPGYLPTVANDVLPFVRLDLVSYSAYDSSVAHLPWGSDTLFRSAIAYLKSRLAPGASFGADSVYIGELGFPENERAGDGQRIFDSSLISTAIRRAVGAALEQGCPWLFYWQLYDNEANESVYRDAHDPNDAVRGFYLYRPDGSPSWAANSFSDILPTQGNP